MCVSVLSAPLSFLSFPSFPSFFFPHFSPSHFFWRCLFALCTKWRYKCTICGTVHFRLPAHQCTGFVHCDSSSSIGRQNWIVSNQTRAHIVCLSFLVRASVFRLAPLFIGSKTDYSFIFWPLEKVKTLPNIICCFLRLARSLLPFLWCVS